MATVEKSTVVDLAIQRINQYGYEAPAEHMPSLLYAVDRAMELARNFCHITDLPEDMKFALADIAVSYFFEPLASVGTFTTGSEVSSIKVGDTSVNFGGTSGTSATQIVNDLMDGGRRELLRFRKLLF